MREIGINTKYRVIELFLAGYSYDEIVEQLDISKGSVVKIINDFREGILQLPQGMTAYVDELRRVAVDMRKNHISLPQLATYQSIYSKCQEIGVDRREVEGWLDIVQDIASSTTSGDRFVEMISELVRVSSETGLHYNDLIEDYQAKMAALEELNRAIEQKTAQLEKMKLEHEREKTDTRKELNSIKRELSAARDSYKKQMADLQDQLDEYMSKYRLSWHKVNTVHALLKDELIKAGAKEKDVSPISKKISAAGSLAIFARRTRSEIARFQRQEEALVTHVDSLAKTINKLQLSITGKRTEEYLLDSDIETKRDRLAYIEKLITEYMEDIRVSRLIIEFIVSPDRLTVDDFDQLFRLMVILRNQRKAIGCRLDQLNEHTAYARIMPALSIYISKYVHGLQEAGEKLAFYLAPIAKDAARRLPESRVNVFGKSIQELRSKL